VTDKDDSDKNTPATGEPGAGFSSAERAEPGVEPDLPGEGTELQPAQHRTPLVAGRSRQGMFGVHDAGDTTGFGGLRLPAYLPPPAERPYGGWFDEFVDALAEAMAERGIPATAIEQITVDRGEITLYLQRDHLGTICQAMRDDAALRFELCSSVSAVDYGADVPDRLHSVTNLTSMTYRRRVRLEVAVGVEDPHVPSIVSVYPTADAQERENWDLFGIVYDGHPALTRILMPDDWDGHPGRKDYPLGGIPVEYKGAEIPPPDQRRAYS
jgi:NADH-quinone oxidoreductase subunit C